MVKVKGKYLIHFMKMKLDSILRCRVIFFTALLFIFYSSQAAFAGKPAFSLNDIETPEMVIKVRAMPKGEGNFFIVFAHDDINDEAYTAGGKAGENKWSIGKIGSSGTELTFAQAWEPINTDIWYVMEVSVVGNTVHLYVNGDEKMNYTFPGGAPVGRVGIGGIQNGALFDDLEIILDSNHDQKPGGIIINRIEDTGEIVYEEFSVSQDEPAYILIDIDNKNVDMKSGTWAVSGQVENTKVTICHIPPGDPGNAHTIVVSENAVEAHLAHGDYLGSCQGGDDGDDDGVDDDNDNCPLTANADQSDADGDGVGDACDACPNDPDNDADSDGVCGNFDICPNDPAKTNNAGQCGCGQAETDSDGDGTSDCVDACPNDPDNDADGDGICGDFDVCPNDPAKTNNAGQCGCRQAETDSDGDGTSDCIDTCPNDPDNDADSDGVCGNEDNCPVTANADQADTDGDGKGDACEIIIPGMFYSVDPSASIARLIRINPDTAGVEEVFPLTGYTGFMSNSLAFNPAGELYGWDNINSRLYRIDLTSGEIIYVSGGPEAHQWVNGLTFDRDGNLYGLDGTSDELLSIDTETGDITEMCDLGVDIGHSGMAIDFDTDELYAISGLTPEVDYLLKINKEWTSRFSDDFSVDTTGAYAWAVRSDYPEGTGYQWNSAGYVRMDGIYNGLDCCWIPASIEAERTLNNIPSSGYARMNFTVIQNGEGQSRIIFILKQDDNNWYRFAATDGTYGSSGPTETVEKKVNGVIETYIEDTHHIDDAGDYVMEVWWSPSGLRMDINGVTVRDVQTVDTVILNPTSFVFRVYRFEADWEAVAIYDSPGCAEIIGPLGVDGGEVGAEFNPVTGELFTVRNSDRLMKVNIYTGEAVEVGILGDGAKTTNLASPWPDVTNGGLCPAKTIGFSFSEPQGSVTASDDSGILIGLVSTPDMALPGDGYFHGDGVSTNYIDFESSDTYLKASRAMTIEALIKPSGLEGTDNYIRRILARDSTSGNYQISVWRNNSWETYEAPAGTASIALWLSPVDPHGGQPWKLVITDYNACPIVSEHWYRIKAVWNSDKASGIPGDIFVDDMGFDGNGSDENWSGFRNCTDWDQSLITYDRHLAPGDEIIATDSDFIIGANLNAPHSNNLFKGLIDRIIWKPCADYSGVDDPPYLPPPLPPPPPVKDGDFIISEVETLDGAIYYFDSLTGELNLLATGGPINHPEGMAVASDGRIIVADWWAWDTVANATSGPRGVYAITPADGSIAIIREGEPFITPIGVVIDDNGNLIVIDHGTNSAQGKVFLIHAATGEVLASNTHPEMYSPQGIVKDETTGDVYIADHNGKIFHLDQGTFNLTRIGSFPGAMPQDLIVAGDGMILMAGLNGQIMLLNPATGAGSFIFNDDNAGDVVPSGSSFDSLEWIDSDTFAVVNHFSAGDIFTFNYDTLTQTITGVDVIYNDGEVYGGPLYIPLGIERYTSGGQ